MILRPYQVAGYQWLNYLSEINWGGILADDMGLGKTVQALSFVEHYKNTTGKLKALVVCPTTLIYNWENEIRLKQQQIIIIIVIFLMLFQLTQYELFIQSLLKILEAISKILS